MTLKKLVLENFRNHKKKTFHFNKTTLIIGKNTAGKTNVLEAITFLSTGKSFRAEQELDTISSDFDFTKITGIIEDQNDKNELTVILSVQNGRFGKRFLVNNVSKRLVDFASNFYSVLFTPQDIEIIYDSPSLRRRYIDRILLQSSRQYRLAHTIYDRSLRHRNRMLWDSREGKKNYRTSDFEYWDALLIENGNVITEAREAFIEFVNSSEKNIFKFDFFYDKSTITPSRLEKYYDAERAAAVTLVGPQRDDFVFFMPGTKKAIREFGSRGEQRLTLLQMKVFEMEYLKQKTDVAPILLLDDIFSELDEANIHKVFELVDIQQTIITTTHEEFVPEHMLMLSNESLKVINL